MPPRKAATAPPQRAAMAAKELAKERRAEELFNYITAQKNLENEQRRRFFDDHIKKQQVVIDRVAELLEAKRVLKESEIEKARKNRLDARRLALTAIHADSVKVRGDSKRISSAHLMLASKVADPVSIYKDIEQHRKSGQPLDSILHIDPILRRNTLQNISAQSMPTQVPDIINSLGAVGGDLRVSTPGTASASVGRKTSVAFQTMPTGSSSDIQNRSLLNIENIVSVPERRRSSAAITSASQRTTSVINTGASQRNMSIMSAGNTTGARNSRYNTSVINETPEFEAEAQCEPATTPTIKKKALFKSSAYKRQVQELAQIKSEYNPQIIPVSRRYDSAKIKEAVNGVVDNHRHTRSADPNSEYASESIFRSFKIKYDRAVTAERRLKEEKPILESIEDVQNDVFHRLSQKKHMLVQATKNRKKASKFRLNELGRPSIYSVSSSAAATGRFSTIDVADVRATTEFQFGGPQKSESYDEYDDFFGSDDSLDFSLGPKIPDPEEEWNTAEGRMLLGLVETRAKVGRRGPLILESLPRSSKKESISRRGSASNAAHEATSKRTRKVSICPVAGNETPNNPVRVQKLFSANTINSLTEEQESVISRDSQYEGRKSSMKRASSAGGRVKFELDKELGNVAIPAVISESIHEEFDEEIVLKSPPSINPVNLIGLDSYESPYQLKCEKWAPLTMSAVDDFRKTIIPTCSKTVPKIDEIASAVEEKIALPKLMRVWVNPVE